MCQSFCHLHNHTEYSLLDGATRIGPMVDKAKEFGMEALAISDHGVMFGAIEFYMACKKKGIKPIIGMEAYIAPGGIHSRSPRENKDSFHLLLLAKNAEGYRNLCRLHSVAALEGFYRRPRIDHEILRRHSAGLISSTTCMGSEVNQALIEGDYDKAKDIAAMYRDIFDEGCYFVELQNHGIPEQAIMEEGLVKIARELKLPLVATNDSHYLCQTDSVPHDVLLAIGTGALLSDEGRFKFKGDDFYLKSPEEMAGLFPHLPESLENTKMISDMVNLEIEMGRNLMPNPDLPEGMSPADYLRHLAYKGLKERMPASLRGQAEERLEYELGVIAQCGYDSYFLLVREFATFTRGNGIQFGVRGSAAGSLVAYTVGITDVDPIAHDLTFERFLNPERISMPDIDMDFEDRRRDEVIHWVTEKYGRENVAQIITFGTLGAKAAIRDSGRVMGFEPKEVDRIAKLIPTGPNWTIDKALRDIVDFRNARDGDPRIRKLIETAHEIEGISRHAGVHAAGVVISSDPLSEIVPLTKGSDGQAVTAYPMGILEKLGLLKMDFLGLSNLTVVARTIENLKSVLGETLDDKLIQDHPILQHGIHGIPFDDDATYDLLGRGETVGVFQLESGGMRKNILELKPRNVGELAAMVALYRPGPIGEIPTFIDRKFGRKPTEYLHPLMEPILKETYGVIVYQEQVQKLAQNLAGFSLGKGDVLRRAMGKKQKDILDSMLPEFKSGCLERGVPEETAMAVWELLIPFADYAFNKAHAVCYGVLAYQTAYLKAHYPHEYMAALLACYREKEDRIVAFIQECRHMGISVLPPDVNLSSVDFTVETTEQGRKVIRFGLAAIKGVGPGLVQKIIEERKAGPYTHLYDFCERCRPFALNKGALEAMVEAGALSSIEPNRQTLLDHLEAGLAYADLMARTKEAGQDSLFGDGPDAGDARMDHPQLPVGRVLSRSDILAMEKKVMGIYISDHPLRGLERSLAAAATHTCAQALEADSELRVTLAGLLTSAQHGITRKTKQKMVRFTLEDFSGSVSGMILGENYNKVGHLVEKDAIVSLKGSLKVDERPGAAQKEITLFVNEVKPLDLSPNTVYVPDAGMEGGVVVRVARAGLSQVQKLKELVERNPGGCDLVLEVEGVKTEAPYVLLYRVSRDPQFLADIRHTLEECTIEFVPGDGLVEDEQAAFLGVEPQEGPSHDFQFL